MPVTQSGPTNSEARFSWEMLISSSIGGAGGAALCFPFEGLKKKFQSGQRVTVLDLYPKELYRGVTPFALSVTLATVTSMAFNRIIQSMPMYDPNSLAWNGSSAIFSGMLGALVGSTPVENIILKQQMEKTGPIHAIRIMLGQGCTRLWVGLPELAMREAGFAGCMLWGVEAARSKASEITQNKTIASTAGFGTALFGAAFTHPFDTIATIKQKNDGKLSSSEAFSLIYKKNGYSGFFKGLSQRAFLFSGCAFSIPHIERAVRRTLFQDDR